MIRRVGLAFCGALLSGCATGGVHSLSAEPFETPDNAAENGWRPRVASGDAYHGKKKPVPPPKLGYWGCWCTITCRLNRFGDSEEGDFYISSFENGITWTDAASDSRKKAVEACSKRNGHVVTPYSDKSQWNCDRAGQPVGWEKKR